MTRRNMNAGFQIMRNSPATIFAGPCCIVEPRKGEVGISLDYSFKNSPEFGKLEIQSVKKNLKFRNNFTRISILKNLQHFSEID